MTSYHGGTVDGRKKEKKTRISIQLADRSIKYPLGACENLLVKVNKFIFPVNFVVLEMDEDELVPIILGRPFLATAWAVIDFHEGKLSPRVGSETATFNIRKSIRSKYSCDDYLYCATTLRNLTKSNGWTRLTKKVDGMMRKKNETQKKFGRVVITLEDPIINSFQQVVIKFEDSYAVHANTTTTDTTSGEKSRRTVTLTAEDMQRKKNDVKARTTLLLSFPDEHQLRFSKYKTARELWPAILKTFVGNVATKKTKKNLLKQQYGNFKAEGSETLEQTFNRLQGIIGQLQFMDVEIKQDDLNQKFLTTKQSRGKEDGNTACVPTASTNVPTASASIATISQDTACAYIASQSSELPETKTEKGETTTDRGLKLKSRLKALMVIDRVGWDWSYMENDEEDHALVADEKLETLKEEKEGVDGKLAGLLKASKDLDNLIKSQRSDKNKNGLGYSAVPPPPAQLYLSPKKDLSWTGLPECADDTVTDYSRPSPTVESKTESPKKPPVKHNVVRGLPTKCFENDYTCTACLKRKQHKASLTDDSFRFTWTFFLKSKDETSGILKKFIIEIENLKDLKVKIIRCDNGGEFRNKEMNDFCSQKGIKREFSNARTLQQNVVAKRRNRTLIEASRTMLADAKLPVTF
nr:hypothetical protein [Tanacetum cinerariifolium]